MRKVYATAVACSLLLAAVPSRADEPVIDLAAIKYWIGQAEAMTQTVNALKSQLQAMTDIPQDLATSVQGLLTQAVSNPLGQITQNLETLMRGSGPGSCGNAQTFLTSNTYQAPTGTDFTAQSMNQSINRAAGLQACTQQLMIGTQSALTDMPQLLTQLAGATDVTQAVAISGRIQYQTATISAQQQQAQLLASTSLLQAQMSQQAIDQKQRADAQEFVDATSPGTPAGNIPAVLPAPQPFAGN